MSNKKPICKSPRFEIEINGELQCTAGLREFGTLGLDCTCVIGDPKRYESRKRSDVTLSEWTSPSLTMNLGGIDQTIGLSQILTWLQQSLQQGDELTIRILPPGEYDEHKSAHVSQCSITLQEKQRPSDPSSES